MNQKYSFKMSSRITCSGKKKSVDEIPGDRVKNTNKSRGYAKNWGKNLGARWKNVETSGNSRVVRSTVNP